MSVYTDRIKEFAGSHEFTEDELNFLNEVDNAVDTACSERDSFKTKYEDVKKKYTDRFFTPVAPSVSEESSEEVTEEIKIKDLFK